MIPDFAARFDSAYDLRCYQLSKGGYIDASTDTWEYLCWEPEDPADIEEGTTDYTENDNTTDEF